MDFLLALIYAVIFPFGLSTSHVDYQSRVGVLGALLTNNTYQVELMKDNSPEGAQNVIIPSSVEVETAYYGLRPEFFVDYSFNFNRVWFAGSAGWEPIITKINYATKIQGTEIAFKPKTYVFDYFKGPYVGLKGGLILIKGDPFQNNVFKSIGVTAYGLAGIERIYYENNDIAATNGTGGKQAEYSYKPLWGAGVKIDLKSRWSAYVQYKSITLDSAGSSLGKQIQLTETEMQFGIAYWFDRPDNIDKEVNRNKTYQDVVKILSAPVKEIGDKEDNQIRAHNIASQEQQLVKDMEETHNDKKQEQLDASKASQSQVQDFSFTNSGDSQTNKEAIANQEDTSASVSDSSIVNSSTTNDNSPNSSSSGNNINSNQDSSTRSSDQTNTAKQ